jgi:hypothetical protein
MCWKNSPGGLKRVELAATAADLAIGDLDADGKPDLTIAHPGGVLCKAIGDPGSVGIYLGKDGIFDDSPAPPGPFPASLSLTGQVNPRSVDLGDLDGDGQPELLAVANNQSADVSVLLYDRRRAAFGPKVSYAAGQYPYVVRAREVNGDGRLDLVVANDQGNRVRVLLGDGSGRFFAAPGTVVEDVALPVPLANALDPLLASLAVGRLVPQGEAGAPADIVVSSVSAYDCKLAKQAPDPRLVVWLGVRP